jgi:DNA-binding SARP family transcriptional activator
MEFSILGPLEVRNEHGAVALGGMKPRALLAYLLLHANEPVSSERLAVALWGDDASGRTAVKNVQVHVSRLRKALGDPDVLTTTAAGYRLSLDPDDLDAECFARLVEEGRRALGDDDHVRAGTVLREALALWHGPALADLAFEPFVQTEIARLEEQRLAALEARIEADLAAGQHASLIGELYRLVPSHPTRERLSGQLMLALYRCGRQAEALDVYSRIRATQARELGLDPSPALKTLQAQILRQAPGLDLSEEPAATAPAIQAPALTRASPRTTVARRPIVGRNFELDELRGALDDARDGRGSLFLLLGDAGIGKTRVAEAIVEEAAVRGHDVLWGSAWEAASAYWPWTQVIRQLLDARATEEVLADLGEGARYVAQIVPQVGSWLGTRGDPLPTLESETARFNAFDSIASFLRAAAARRPIVLVLDDLHAADAASVRLVEFLARGLHGAHILAITTCRTDGARRDSEVTSALTDLLRAARRLTLSGLSRDEVVELTAAQSPQQLPGPLIDRLYALTEGNPLFVDEVMRMLDAQGALAASEVLDSGRLPIPAAVRHTVGRRLDALEPAVVHAMTAASVIGAEFRLDTLAPVLGEERAAVLSHLEAAADVGLVQELVGTLGSYRFTHALLRETFYDDLGAKARAILHGRVGEAMVEIHGTGLDAPLSELAHHFVEAAPVGDIRRAASYAARAGERALELMAYEQAIEHFGDALRVLELEPQQPARRGPVLLALGQAEMRAGRLDVSRATLRRAAEDARALGDAELLARAALASAPWGMATALAHEESLIPLIQEALDRLALDDSALRAQLLARLAAALYWSATSARRELLVSEAIAMARRVGDPTTLAFVLSEAHRATWDPDSPDRSLPWASEIYALAERLGNMELAMIAHSWRISLLLELGEMTVVDREIETFQRVAARLHQQRAQAQGLLHRSGRAIIVGRFAEAEALLGEAAEYATLLQQDPFLSMRLGGLAFVMREVQGRLDELEVAVRQFADSQPAMPVWRCALLCVYLQSGREDELRHEYDRLAAEGFDALPRDNLWLSAVALLTEACAHLGDRANAAALRVMLAPYAGRNVVSPDVVYLGPVDRYLALLAATQDDDPCAAMWFASARDLAERMGARPTMARLALDEARWLRESDPQRAAELITEAAAGAEALGLVRLVARAHALAVAPSSQA